MMVFAALEQFEKDALCAKFIESLGGNSTLTRDNFDIWIIDNNMADDPGTTDTTSIAHKGFVQQRSNARKSLNNWGAKQNPPFAIEVDKELRDTYHVKRWEDNAFAVAADIGNRVEKFTKNKMKAVAALKHAAVDAQISDDSVERLLKMMSQLEGYGLIMQRNIKAEVVKYNKLVDSVEEAAEGLMIEAEAKEA